MSNNDQPGIGPAPVTIREALPADAPALHHVAQRDSARSIERPALVALVDGELRAALSMANGTVIADPFHRTAELVEMLRLHARRAPSAERLRGGSALTIRRGRFVPRLRRALRATP